MVASGSAATAVATITPGAGTAEKIYPQTWPSIEQYFLAMTRPKENLSDDKLQSSVMVPTSGKTTAFKEVNASTAERLTLTACVIKGPRNLVVRAAAADHSKEYAVKFFLQNLSDRHTRYDAIHRLKKNNSNRYFVPFVYQPQGVQVDTVWFPVLKMLWVGGMNLEDYVKHHLTNGNIHAVEDLAAKFEAMIGALHADGIAHGDLDPTNILVDEKDNLKIVDYDAMYVPPLAHLSGCESGNPAYQHPSRKPIHFGPYLDNYAAIQIFGMLRCLHRHPPSNYWNWDELIKANLTLMQRDTSSTPKIGGAPKPARFASSETRTGWFTGNTHPLFGQAPEEEKSATSDSFEEARQRLVRILKSQRLKRIDQVDTLSMTARKLF